MTISVILVNYNGLPDTIECLKSLKHLRSDGITVEIIVVDNLSNNNQADKLSDLFPFVRVIRQQTNTGFCHANNIGIQQSMLGGSQYIWVLNNDTVVDENALSVLKILESDSIGAVGSKIYFAKGYEFHKNRYTKQELGTVLWYAGGTIDWKNVYVVHRGLDQPDIGQYDKAEETEFITGCSFFTKISVLKKTGLFDERYFAYWEDADLGMRIRKCGYRLMYAPTSIVYHRNASSSGKPGSDTHVYYQTRNRLLFGMKYSPLRTKFALIRQMTQKLRNGTQTEKSAIIHALTGRWGKKH